MAPELRIPSEHKRVSALFLGPKAENAETLKECFDLILERLCDGRRQYAPEDESFLPSSLRGTTEFTQKADHIKAALKSLLDSLANYSIPFYHPRYSAHMSVDQSLPAILGYVATMFFNPNNVAFEGSPFTTQLELHVGRQLCQILGYNVCEVNPGPHAWGHITCGGSVANLESIWASRNLKFYPLSLRLASNEGERLHFIASTFEVETCLGTIKLLKDCDLWELLNLKLEKVVEIPERLYSEYRISSRFLEDAMHEHIMQTTGMDTLMRKWRIEVQPILFVPSTKHYSWPKAAAIAGIGSKNTVDVAIDRDARMDMKQLRKQLDECVKDRRAVYEVVAVMGTTEEGAVDRLDELVNIRSEFEQKGLTFVIHADAAWGGYFVSTVPESYRELPSVPDSTPGHYVPLVDLDLETKKQLSSLKYADSITIDPHKSGYVPYPAGGLCYRDGRMRYLLTWDAPYINQGAETGQSIGTYGVEGSKPGAAAAAVYLAHIVIGLGPEGYGALLSEAVFSCRRYASHWATMSTQADDFIVVPLNRLPSEKSGRPSTVIEAEKQFIRKRILRKDNSELGRDIEAMRTLVQLGSDLNINAFACNFRYADGRFNEDVAEANRLNQSIYERLSVSKPKDDPLRIPFYITSTVFKQKDYGVCNDEFKKRLMLKGDQDLFVLRNVVMSPFATTYNFVSKMADEFKKVLIDEVKKAQDRNAIVPKQHTFRMQGIDQLYFVLVPTFHRASSRRQLIFTAEIPGHELQKYKSARASSSNYPMLRIRDPLLLDDIDDGATFNAEVLFTEDDSGAKILVEIFNVKVIKKRSLDTEHLESSYPADMPFYLYGTTHQQHIDHMLLFAPNIALTATDVKLELDRELTAEELAEGVIAYASNIFEASMQPFPEMQNMDIDENFFFCEGKALDVTIYRDPFPASTMDPIPLDQVKDVITQGKLTLRKECLIDSDELNADKVPSNKLSDSDAEAWRSAVSHLAVSERSGMA